MLLLKLISIFMNSISIYIFRRRMPNNFIFLIQKNVKSRDHLLSKLLSRFIWEADVRLCYPLCSFEMEWHGTRFLFRKQGLFCLIILPLLLQSSNGNRRFKKQWLHYTESIKRKTIQIYLNSQKNIQQFFKNSSVMNTKWN